MVTVNLISITCVKFAVPRVDTEIATERHASFLRFADEPKTITDTNLHIINMKIKTVIVSLCDVNRKRYVHVTLNHFEIKVEVHTVNAFFVIEV